MRTQPFRALAPFTLAIFAAINAVAVNPIGWGNNSNGQITFPAQATGYTQLALGFNHSVLLCSDGTVMAFGDNSFGQTNVPVSLSGVSAIAAGEFHTLALTTNGTVIGWGDNAYGQCNGVVSDAIAISTGFRHSVAARDNGTAVAWGDNSFGQLNVPSNLSNVVAISAGGFHTLALTEDGRVQSWGYSATQTNQPSDLTNAVAVAAGHSHSLALRANGKVAAWGNNTFKQTTVPAGLSNVIAVAAGFAHSAALKSDGSVVCWGYNSSGQTNPPATLMGAVAISAGGNTTAALTPRPVITTNPVSQTAVAGGSVQFTSAVISGASASYRWQLNGADINGASDLVLSLTNISFAQAGNYRMVASNAVGIAISSNALLSVSAILFHPQSQSVAAGSNVEFNVIAVENPSTTYQWQFNSANIADATASTLTLTNVQTFNSGNYRVVVTNSDVVQTSTPASLTVNIPPSITTQLSDQAADAGTTATFAVDASGTMPLRYIWQFNGTNIAGATNATLILNNVQSSDAGHYSVTVNNGGGIATSEANLSVTDSAPSLIVPPSDRIGFVYGTARFAVSAVGTTLHYQWRFHDADLDGQTNSQLVLTNLQLSNAGSYSVVFSNQLGIMTSAPVRLMVKSHFAPGTVAAWGDGPSGQTNVPIDLTELVAISCGYEHSLALKKDGSVAGWGRNDLNQASVPTNLTNAVAIAARVYHSLALTDDGTVVGWGYNQFGQAVAPPGLSNVIDVATGYSHSLVLKTDGSVFAWGRHTSGQTNVPPDLTNAVAISAHNSFNLALRNDGNVVAWGSGPTNVPIELSNVVAIAAGYTHAMALKNDGSVVAWGDNSSGQTNVPAGLSNVVAIAGGISFSVALKNDGAIIAWGSNSRGQLNPPIGFSRALSISAGRYHGLMLNEIPSTRIEIVMDNPTATFVGDWSTGTSATNKYGSDYRFKSQGAGFEYAQYTPNLPIAGNYEVFEVHPHGSNRSVTAPYIITFSGGSQIIYVNQKTNGGKWNSLGTYSFSAGTNGYVKLTDAFPDAGQVVIADAVKFVYQQPAVVLEMTPAVSGLVLSWDGNPILQSATNANGPFLDIPGASSPFTNGFTESLQFFRLRQ